MKELIAFIEFSQKFALIERITLSLGKKRNENDAEHSFQLALSAWYLNEKDSLGLDVSRIARYALVHDLVEAYAGDTIPSYGAVTEERNTKRDREAAALARIRKEFPEASELWKWIVAYEAKEDPESNFVYALDKILPIINIYLNDGAEFEAWKVTLAMLIREKEHKVKAFPAIEKYFWELVDLLRASGKIREK